MTKKELVNRTIKKFSEGELVLLKEATPETKTECGISKFMKKELSSWETAKNICKFLEIGKNSLYDNEDNLIYKKIGKKRKLYYVDSVVNYIRGFSEEKKEYIIQKKREDKRRKNEEKKREKDEKIGYKKIMITDKNKATK